MLFSFHMYYIDRVIVCTQTTVKKQEMKSSISSLMVQTIYYVTISSLVRIWKICHLGPSCVSYDFTNDVFSSETLISVWIKNIGTSISVCTTKKIVPNNLKKLFYWINCLQIVVKKKKVHSDENYHPRTDNQSSRLNLDISYTPTEVSHIITW